jgi:hypothetical protein
MGSWLGLDSILETVISDSFVKAEVTIAGRPFASLYLISSILEKITPILSSEEKKMYT